MLRRPPDGRITHSQHRPAQEDLMGFVRRRARRRTALVVGGAAYAAGRHRGREQGYEDAGYEQEQAPPPQKHAPPPPRNGPKPSTTRSFNGSVSCTTQAP